MPNNYIPYFEMPTNEEIAKLEIEAQKSIDKIKEIILKRQESKEKDPHGSFIEENVFWWPLSHWIYPDFYHQLLGFSAGSYQDSMVKVIGTCGIFPVVLCFLTAKNPIRNKDAVIVLILSGFFIAFTFLYLIISGYFPNKELINVGLSLFSAVFLGLVYPWKWQYKI